jgi:hypothetical protein
MDSHCVVEIDRLFRVYECATALIDGNYKYSLRIDRKCLPNQIQENENE